LAGDKQFSSLLCRPPATPTPVALPQQCSSRRYPSRAQLEDLVVRTALEKGYVSPSELSELLSRGFNPPDLPKDQAKRLKKAYRRYLYTRFSRICKSYTKKGYFRCVKIPYHSGLAPNASKRGMFTVVYEPLVNLTYAPAFLKRISCKAKSNPSKSRFPSRAHPLRKQGMLLAFAVNMISDDLEWMKIALGFLLNEYLKYTKHNRILMASRNPDPVSGERDFLSLPYRNRFSKRRLRKALAIYDAFFDRMRHLADSDPRFRSLVYLTFTTDPEAHPSLLDACKAISPNLNRILSWTSKQIVRQRINQIPEPIAWELARNSDPVSRSLSSSQDRIATLPNLIADLVAYPLASSLSEEPSDKIARQLSRILSDQLSIFVDDLNNEMERQIGKKARQISNLIADLVAYPLASSLSEEPSDKIARQLSRILSDQLSKKYYRPPYLAVNEFTKTGLPHVHLLLPGVRRITNKYAITDACRRSGQGSINYACSLSYSRGRWIGRIGNRRISNLAPYLKKYLKKAIREALKRPLSSEEPSNPLDLLSFFSLSLYWITGKRFFTYSRRYLPKPEKMPRSSSSWIFIGVFPRNQIEEIVEKLNRSYPSTGPPIPTFLSMDASGSSPIA